MCARDCKRVRESGDSLAPARFNLSPSSQSAAADQRYCQQARKQEEERKKEEENILEPETQILSNEKNDLFGFNVWKKVFKCEH